ncbi:MAG: hypothetical protein PUC05_00300 [Firmicutes bacterium]|nr:hypothetical protein [Bacillota bacterium]
MEQGKKTLHFSKILSAICAVVILLSTANLQSISFAIEEEPQGYDASSLTVENMPQELAALAGFEAHSGTATRTYGLTSQNTLPEKNLSVFDASDLNKITIVNNDGENTSYVFANDIKYIDGNSIYFINNDFVVSNKLVHGTWVAYENASSDKKVYMARRASKGVIYIDGDTVIRVKPNAVRNSIAQLNTFIDNGIERTSVEYADVFGNGTMLQYIAIYGGMKENLYLEQYNGINSFSYTLEIPNMTAALINQGRRVGIYNAEGELIYVFGQPFAEDSYTENGVKQPHYTDNCGYNLAQLGNGKYTLTMWVDPEFLADEDTTYPVVIDPPMEVSKGSIEDATVSSSGNNSSTSTQLSVGFDGNNEYAIYIRNNFLWYYRHLCTSDITNISYVTQKTGGNASGLYVNAYDSNAILNMDTMTFTDLVAAQGTYQSQVMLTVSDNDVTVDITNLAIKWLNKYLNETHSKRADYGFILRAMQGQSGYNRIASAESTGSIYPYFTISYSEDASVENGVYLIKNQQYGSYLTHSVIDYGANVNVLPYRNYDVQMWEIQLHHTSTYGEKIYTISPYKHSDYYLSSAEPQKLYENGVNVELTDATFGQAIDGILWRIVKNGNGSFRIMPAYSTMQALTADNSGVYNSYLYEYYGWPSMKWNLVEPTALDGGFSCAITEPEMPNITRISFENIEQEFNVWPAQEGTRYYNYSSSSRNSCLDEIEFIYNSYTSLLGILSSEAGAMYSHYMDVTSGAQCAAVCGDVCRNICRTYTVDFSQLINNNNQAASLCNADMDKVLEAAEILMEDVCIGDVITFAQTNKMTNDDLTIEDITSEWYYMVHSYNTSSGCIARKTGNNRFKAYITYYLWDVFDWNRNIKHDEMPLLSQEDIWELQYGGRGKGYLVIGTASIEIEWSSGQRIMDNTCELEIN